MSEAALVPKLRFSEFSDEWEAGYLNEFIDSLDAGVSVNSTDRQAESNEKCILKTSCVSSGVFKLKENKVVLDDDEIQRLKEPLQSNTIIISRMNTPALVGANAIVTYSMSNVFLPDRLWAAKINKNYSGKWLGILMSSTKFRAALSARATGTSASMKNITKGDVLSLKITYPAKPEQQKIAAFLTAVDTKIEQLSNKKALLGEYKKGLMQQIFSQAIRFKADDGSDFPNWEEKKLGDILDYEQPTNYIVDSTEYDNSFDMPVLTAGKSFVLGYTNETHKVFENIPVIIFDDFTTANKYVDFPFKVKSSAMKILKPKDSFVNIRLIFEFIQMLNFPIGEHKRYWISEYQDLKIPFPSFEEQTKIASFLSSIDNKIEQVGKQLDESKQFKKALLQQMFV